MSKFFSGFVFLILALFIVSLSAQDVNVSGDWELTMETPRGEVTQEVHFEQDGKNLTVTMTGPRGEAEGEGTINGNEIEWSIIRSTDRGEFTMTFTGTVEGNEMSGEVQLGDFGSREWTAKKK